MILCFSKDCDYVFDLNDEQAIITFEIDGNGAFGIEQHFVVLTQWYVRRVFDLSGNSYDSAGYRRDFYIVGQSDAAFGFFLSWSLRISTRLPIGSTISSGFVSICFFLSISPSSLQKQFIFKYQNYYIFFNAVLQFLCYNTSG